MSVLLIFAYLFFIGSVFGWVLELFFRKFFSSSNPTHKWINPGFCVGPYLPLYGTGLCVLYLLGVAGRSSGLDATIGGRILLFAAMAVSMTVIEYAAGLFLLRRMKLRLWDYSKLWGNVQGLICPLFSFFWAALGAVYNFMVHPYILNALNWLGRNLAFSFVIGYFFGVFTIDVAYSSRLVTRMRQFAEENHVVVRYESFKAHLHALREQRAMRPHFLFSFRSERPIAALLQEAREDVKEFISDRKGR